MKTTEEKHLAFICAKHMIRPYVERGETIKQLKAGMLGSYNENYRCSISGYLGNKKYSSDYIIVSKINKYEVNYAFKLTDVYDSVLKKQITLL